MKKIRTIAAISMGVLLLACGGDESAQPAAPESPGAPAPKATRPSPPAARAGAAAGFAGSVVWGGEGAAPNLQSDIAACEAQVERDPRAATADPGARFLGVLSCLGQKGWKARNAQ